MDQNGKINMNPAGSSHREQLEPKRLTLVYIELPNDVDKNDDHDNLDSLHTSNSPTPVTQN